MKMASVSVVSVFLLCCSAVASQDCNEYAAMGRSFNVRLGYTLQPTDTLKWKFNDKVIFHKKSTRIIDGKTGDINADGSLKLTNLKKDQEGLYTSEVHNNNGVEQNRKETRLCIRDPVKKPKVEATCKEANVIFKCIPDKTSKYEIKKHEWLQNNAQTKKTDLTLTLTAAETKDIKFACNVSNEVSFEISDPVTHNCATSVPGLPGLPDKLWGISIWVFIGGGGGIVILLIIIVIICCIRTKRTRKLRLKDEEELRLEWTNTDHHPNHPPLPDHPPPHHPNRHHHHHHHHQHQQQQQQEQQQAPGNTGPRQSRSKQSRQPRARAPEPNGQPQPSPRRTGQAQKPASDADDEQPPPLPQPRKKGPKTQLD